MENFFWLGLVGAVLALLFAVVQSRKVLSFSEGNDTMKKIAASIRQGANAYLKHQYATDHGLGDLGGVIVGDVLEDVEPDRDVQQAQAHHGEAHDGAGGERHAQTLGAS